MTWTPKEKKEYFRKYRKDNHEKRLIDSRKYYNENKEEINIKATIRRAKNKDFNNAKARERLKRLKREEPERHQKMLAAKRIRSKKFSDENPERVKAWNQNASKEDRARWHKKAYYKDHAKSIADASRRSLKHIKELAPCYINDLLRGRGISPKDATPELIEAFKLQLQIKRELGINN